MISFVLKEKWLIMIKTISWYYGTFSLDIHIMSITALLYPSYQYLAQLITLEFFSMLLISMFIGIRIEMEYKALLPEFYLDKKWRVASHIISFVSYALLGLIVYWQIQY